MRRRWGRTRPSSWVGVLIVGVALVVLGIAIAVATYQPPIGTIHPTAWPPTLVGSVLAGVSIGAMP